MKKSKDSGFSHYLLPFVVVVLLTAIGLAYNHLSHQNAPAAVATASRAGHFHPLRGKDIKRVKKVASDFWGGNVCGNDGSRIRLVWYDNRNFFKQAYKIPSISDNNQQIQLDYGHKALAYAYNLSSIDRHNHNYCRIYLNYQMMAWEYRRWDYPAHHLTSGQFECEVIVHETGHMAGFYDRQGFKNKDGYIDHMHSPSNTNIMYGKGTGSIIQGGTSGAPRCLAEF